MNRTRGRLPSKVVPLRATRIENGAGMSEVSDARDDDHRGPREGWLKGMIEERRRKRAISLLVWGITLLACAAALILTVFSR